MAKLLRLIGSLTVVGGVLAGVVYFLQKRGTLHIEVNYDDKDGKAVTRDLDEIVDTAVGEASEVVTSRIAEITSDVKSSVKKQMDAAGKKKKTIPIPPADEAAEEEE